jgi:hypothetical protein
MHGIANRERHGAPKSAFPIDRDAPNMFLLSLNNKVHCGKINPDEPGLGRPFRPPPRRQCKDRDRQVCSFVEGDQIY